MGCSWHNSIFVTNILPKNQGREIFGRTLMMLPLILTLKILVTIYLNRFPEKALLFYGLNTIPFWRWNNSTPKLGIFVRKLSPRGETTSSTPKSEEFPSGDFSEGSQRGRVFFEFTCSAQEYLKNYTVHYCSWANLPGVDMTKPTEVNEIFLTLDSFLTVEWFLVFEGHFSPGWPSVIDL